MSSHVSLPFFFIRALHPLPPLFTLSYEHHPNITIQELPFTLLLGWHHVVCPISWHMCVFPGKYLNDFILPTNLLSSLEMLQNSGLEMIFPQDFEGNVVLSGISRGIEIRILFMWPCFVGFLFSLPGSFEDILSLVLWNFMMMYRSVGLFPHLSLWVHSGLCHYNSVYFSSGTFSSSISLGFFSPHIFFLFDPFS